MYPGADVLEEVGRVTIAGARLDLQLAYICWHLDPHGEPFSDLRPMAGAKLSQRARRQAAEKLEGALLAEVVTALDDADVLRRERNEVIHQEWVLRGSDAMVSAEEVLEMTEEELQTFMADFERRGTPSLDWLRLPARSTDLGPAHLVDDLRDLERRLGGLLGRLVHLVFKVASARETGSPPGYRPGAE